MTDGSTKTLAIRGATWATLGLGLQRAVQTLSILVLARLLAPEDFGLVAIGVLVLTFANRAKTLGLHTSLIQHDGDERAAADACFLVNTGLTVATVAVIVAISPLISRIFDPRAGALLAVMSLRLVPQALAAVPSALAVKALNFRKQALIQVAEGLFSACVAVVLAFAGLGPWALVAGFLSGSTVGAALWWIRPGWAPSWRLDRGIANELIHAGIRIWSAGNLAHVIDGANRLFIGAMLGVIQLGHYEILGRVVHAPIQTLLGIHDRVAISAFCRERDRERIGRWFLRLSGMMLILTSLVAGPLLFFPDVFIPTLFGPGWEAAIEPARALSPFALLAPLVTTVPVYIATRRTGLLLRFTTIRTVVTIAGLFAAAHFSLTAVCAVESSSACVFAPVNLALAARITGLRLRPILMTLSVPLAGMCAFAFVAVGLRTMFPHSLTTVGLIPLASLLIPSTASLAAAVFAMRPGLVRELRSILSEIADNGPSRVRSRHSVP